MDRRWMRYHLTTERRKLELSACFWLTLASRLKREGQLYAIMLMRSSYIESELEIY
jgi:hypothetical protein